MNKAIQEYLEKYKDQYSRSDLIEQLKKSGYNELEINETADSVYTQDRVGDTSVRSTSETGVKRGKFAMSWSLLKSSLALLSHDKEILLFPVVSAIASILVFVGLFIPLGLVTGIVQNFTNEGAVSFMGYGLLFLYYLVGTCIVAFFNSALVSCVAKRLRGEDPTFRSGIQQALSHKKEIFVWALISATVGLILRIILDTLSQRLGAVGQMISSAVIGLIGVVWGIATYFVIPVIIIENVNTKDAIRTSADLFKKTWGENLIGNVSMSIFFALILIPALLLSLVIAFTLNSMAGAIIGSVLFVASVIFVCVLSSTLNTVFRAVLYIYAKTGAVPEAFEQDVLKQAFSVKQKKAGLFGK